MHIRAYLCIYTHLVRFNSNLLRVYVRVSCIRAYTCICTHFIGFNSHVLLVYVHLYHAYVHIRASLTHIRRPPSEFVAEIKAWVRRLASDDGISRGAFENMLRESGIAKELGARGTESLVLALVTRRYENDRDDVVDEAAFVRHVLDQVSRSEVWLRLAVKRGDGGMERKRGGNRFNTLENVKAFSMSF